MLFYFFNKFGTSCHCFNVYHTVCSFNNVLIRNIMIFFLISDRKDLARYFAKFLTNEKVISAIELLVSVCI